MKNKFISILICLIGSSIIMSARIAHPSLLFTPERVERAKEMIKKDDFFRKGWENIKSVADEQVKGTPDLMKLEYPVLAYQITGDKKYADAVKKVLLSTAKIKSWGDAEMLARTPAWRSELQMAHRAYRLAIAFDALYNDLTPDERTEIAEGLYNLAVEPLLGDWVLEPSRIHSLNSMGHNWWTSCAGMGGLLALAISNEIPEANEGAQVLSELLPEWFEFSGDMIQHKPKTFDDDGGMYESINYASFGITEALLFRMAWANSHPEDKLAEIPQMALIAPFFCHVAYPRTGELYSINFGDSHKNITGESSMLLAYAMGYENPETLWYVKQIEPGQNREGFPITFPMGLLYTPDLTETVETPELPTSHLWNDFGWATMRDSWNPDATMLAVKSGTTWNHSHADANSLILFHKGVDIIKDAGNCSYGKPEYREYFFQSPAHNVVLFNGEGQKTYQQYHGTMLPGKVSSLMDAGNIKYVFADGTGPMSHAFDRNMRHFLWIDNIIYVIDDIHAHEPGHFEWLWHPGGDAKKKGYDLEITNGNSSVAIRPLYPKTLAYSNYVHDYPEDMYWEIKEGPKEDLTGNEEYYSFHLPGNTDRVKGVTAIILKESANDKNLPVIERSQGKDWIGLKVKQGSKITDIYINDLADGRLMHLNSWINPDGWTTDAYLLAISYDEKGDSANPDEVFIGYGSALRRNDRVYYSSLSKHNVAIHNNDVPEITVNGQKGSLITLEGNSSKIKVNGKEVNVGTKENKIKFVTE